MGRWGYTVFQGDTDLDIVSDFEDAVGVSLHDDACKLEEARVKLDAGLGAELFRKYRAKEQAGEDFIDAKYVTLLLGAYFMTIGAKIMPDDREHLSDIFSKIPSRNGYVMPICDDGFRDPGQIQYKAALDNYVDGQPRSFFVPSCFNCGKTSEDIAPAYLKHCVACNKDHKTALTVIKSVRNRTGRSTKQYVDDHSQMVCSRYSMCKPLYRSRAGNEGLQNR